MLVAAEAGLTNLACTRFRRAGLSWVRLSCYARFMTADTKWVVGTGVGIVVAIFTTGVALAALMVSLIAGVNGRLDRIESDMRGLDTRLRAVEVVLGKVGQRLTAPEGLNRFFPDAGQ